jgi:hypothetical protein
MELDMTVGTSLRIKPMLINATEPTMVPASLGDFFAEK